MEDQPGEGDHKHLGVVVFSVLQRTFSQDGDVGQAVEQGSAGLLIFEILIKIFTNREVSFEKKCSEIVIL